MLDSRPPIHMSVRSVQLKESVRNIVRKTKDLSFGTILIGKTYETN